MHMETWALFPHVTAPTTPNSHSAIIKMAKVAVFLDSSGIFPPRNQPEAIFIR
jgi:hypothetical protein